MTKTIQIAGVLGVVVAAVGITGYLLSRRSLTPRASLEKPSSMDEVLAESRRLGMPFTYEELSPPIPDEENAALLVLPIAKRIFDTRVQHNYLNRGPSDSNFAKHYALYQGTQSDLDGLERAVELPSWRIDRPELTITTLTPEYAHIKRAAQLLSYRSIERAAKGETDAAIRSVDACRKLAELMTHEKTTIGSLVAASCDAHALRGVEQMIPYWKSRPELLSRLEKLINSRTIHMDIRSMVRGEFLMLHTDIKRRDLAWRRASKGAPPSSQMHNDGSAPWPAEDVNFDDESANQQIYAELNQVPPHIYLQSIADFLNKLIEDLGPTPSINPEWTHRVEARRRELRQRNRIADYLTYTALPDFQDLETARQHRLLQPKLIIALIQAVRQPTITPELPDDPFVQGQKVRFKREGERIMIWSLGANGKDDGGKSNEGGDDLAVRYPPLKPTKLSPSIS